MAAIRLDTMLNFFVTTEEIADWICGWVKKYHLNALVIRHNPFVLLKDVDWSNNQQIIDAIQSGNELLFDLKGLNTIMTTYSELMSETPDRLSIEHPKETDDSLRAAGIASLSEDPQYLKTWRSIAKDVLSRTRSGMWVVNPTTRAKAYYPRLRYSPRAALAQDAGICLLTFAGEMPVFVNEPDA